MDFRISGIAVEHSGGRRAVTGSCWCRLVSHSRYPKKPSVNAMRPAATTSTHRYSVRRWRNRLGNFVGDPAHDHLRNVAPTSFFASDSDRFTTVG